MDLTNWHLAEDDWFTPTLSEGSFLRRMPRGFKPHDRIVLDSFVLSADIIDYHWRTLVETALQIGGSVEYIAPTTRARLFAAAWGIVDQLHSLRSMTKLFAKRKPFGPKTIDFLACTENATIMRNKLDHIHEHLPNTVSAKKAYPVLGVLGWLYWGTAPALPFQLVMISGGAAAATGSWKFTSGLGLIRTPIDRVSIQLGGVEFQFLEMIRSLRGWLTAQAEAFEESTNRQMAAHAEREGLDLNSMLADIELPADAVLEFNEAQD